MFYEFKCFGDVSVKISYLLGFGSGDEWVVFVNFWWLEDVWVVKYVRGCLVFYDWFLKIEVVYVSWCCSCFFLDKDIYFFLVSVVGVFVGGYWYFFGGGGG